MTEAINWRVWIVVLFLTLLLHLMVFLMKFEWSPAPMPPRVEVQQIDPRKIEAIRKQWRDKALLLNKDKSRPSEKEAPPDARYMSDRNIRVEKEQRARDTNVVPKQGKPGPPAASKQSQAKPEPQTRPVPNLGSLGVPFRLNRPIPPQQQYAQSQVGDPSPYSGDDAGDQTLNDNQLPIGGENLLNAQESIYYSFYARIYEAIGPIWQSMIRQVGYRRKVPQGEYVTVVDVVFDKDGHLVAVNHQKDSGIPEFDSAVDASWQRVGRFPNPPQGLLNDRGEVHTGWTFRVLIGEGFGVQYLPPERVY